MRDEERKKWTYEGVSCFRFDMFDLLALRGAKGWELVAVLPDQDQPDTEESSVPINEKVVLLVLKRELHEGFSTL